MAKRRPRCCFCAKNNDENPGMIILEGLPNHFICEKCVRTSNKIVEKEAKQDVQDGLVSRILGKNLTPRKIVEHLDLHIVGQTDAKKVLSVAVYNHYKRIIHNNVSDDVKLFKSNVLMIGNSGMGKSALVRALATVMEVPLAVGDATSLTEAGYVGDDVETLLSRLLQASENNVQLAEMGIVYIDEVDKLAKKTPGSSSRDVGGEGVQQGLLKMLEGSVCSVNPGGGRKQSDQKTTQVDTSNILFVCSGTFAGLDDIISQRSGKAKMGFNTEVTETSTDILSDDLIAFGFIPEFIGRLPVVVSLADLTDEELVRVLKEPKDSLVGQYQKIFETEGCSVTFDDDALMEVVVAARLEKTGARGLRKVMEKFMTGIMFDLPDQPKKDYVIDRDVVLRKKSLFS